MKIPYGNKMYDVDDTVIYRIGKKVESGPSSYVHAEYVHNGTIQSVR